MVVVFVHDVWFYKNRVFLAGRPLFWKTIARRKETGERGLERIALSKGWPRTDADTDAYFSFYIGRSIVRIMREFSPRCFFSLSSSVYHLHKVYAENG